MEPRSTSAPVHPACPASGSAVCAAPADSARPVIGPAASTATVPIHSGSDFSLGSTIPSTAHLTSGTSVSPAVPPAGCAPNTSNVDPAISSTTLQESGQNAHPTIPPAGCAPTPSNVGPASSSTARAVAYLTVRPGLWARLRAALRIGAVRPTALDDLSPVMRRDVGLPDHRTDHRADSPQQRLQRRLHIMGPW